MKRLKPKPPVAEDCSDVERVLEQMRKPKGAVDKRPPQNRRPLSSDEVAIYRAVTLQWTAGDRGALNVAIETFPFDVSSETPSCECLKGTDPENLLQASHSVHTLTQNVLPQTSVKLVDPHDQHVVISHNDPGNSIAKGRSVDSAVNEAFSAGLFSLSEIAFDTEHHRAIVSYSFVCGSLCSSGRTLVFEKIGDEWKPAKTECGGWVS